MTRRRLAAIAGIVLAGAAAATLAAAWWFANTFVSSANRPVVMPADFPAIPVSITGEGHAIAGSWADVGAGAPAVLLVHGMRGDRLSMLPRARLLRDAGFSTLLIDLQAHGETPGKLITLGWRESADVRAALAWLRSRAPGRRVGIVAISLGGAAALHGDRPAQPDALVLEAVHPRLRPAIENRVGRVMTPLLVMQIEPRLGVTLSQLDPIRGIDAVHAPVMVVGGELDPWTTADDTRALFAAAREPKSLWIVPHAVHEDFSHVDAAGYREHVIGFLRAQLAEPAH